MSSLYPGLPDREVLDGVSITRIKARTRIGRIFGNWVAYRRLFAGRIDVVIEEVEGPQGPFLLKGFVKKPIVLMWHQRGRKIFLGSYGPVLGRLLSLLDYAYGRIYQGDFVVVPSLKSKQDLSAVAKRERILVVSPGVPNSLGLPLSLRSEGPRRACEGLYFITVNKIRRYKALDHVVRAFGLVAAEFPAVKIVIAGVMDDTGYAKELADLGESVAPGRVFVFPDLSTSEREDLVRGAYAFVLPSPVEGFSLAALEAMALGTPAIVSDGIPEDLVVDGYNGLRYPYGDLPELAARYRYLLDHPEARDGLSAAAKGTAAKLSWENSATKFEIFLRELISRPPHRQGGRVS